MLSIRAAREAIDRGTLAAAELAARCLDQIDKFDGSLNAFAARADREIVLEQAARIDGARREGKPLGLLAGIPVAIKDIYATEDFPTTASSKVFAGHQTKTDAFAVAKLRGAGVLIVGKTQTHEFAYGPTTVNEFAGPSRNPWNPDHVPGGSSGGSAIAVATGMCLGATGSDTGGSIRHPSAFCGISGLKPTYGLISRRGIFPLSWTLDHAGPMARSVDDLAFLLQAMAGHDPSDQGSADVAVPDYVDGITQPGGALRVGVPKEHFFDTLDPDVREAFEGSIRCLKKLGASIREVGLPKLRYALGAELAILSAEASAYHRPTMLKQPGDVSPNVRKELDAGMVVLATDYLLGQRVRRIIADEFASAFNFVDILATPTIPIPAPRIDQAEVEIDARKMSALDAIWRNSYPTNLTGSPTLCLPNGFTHSGLPTSLQLIGKNFDEMTLLRVGRQLQAETDWHKRTPALGLPTSSE